MLKVTKTDTQIFKQQNKFNNSDSVSSKLMMAQTRPRQKFMKFIIF